MNFRNSRTSLNEDSLAAFGSEVGRSQPRPKAPDSDDPLDSFAAEPAAPLARPAPVLAERATQSAAAPQPSSQPHPRPTSKALRSIGARRATGLAVCFALGVGLNAFWLVPRSSDTSVSGVSAKPAPVPPPDTPAATPTRSQPTSAKAAPAKAGSSRNIAVPLAPDARELRPPKPVNLEATRRPSTPPPVSTTGSRSGKLPSTMMPSGRSEPPAPPERTERLTEPPVTLPSVLSAPPAFALEKRTQPEASNERAPRPLPAPPPPAAAPVARPEDGIVSALSLYQSAYQRLDASAAQRVWPSVNEAALARAFQNLESQDLSLSDCRFEVNGTQAQATCSGTARYVRRVGSKVAQQEQRQWLFRLSKDASTWKIDSVQTR